MRAIAACQFTLTRFGVWRAAIAGLLVCVLASLAVWWLARPIDWQWRFAAAAGLAALAAVALAASLIQIKAVSLRWDGQRWHLGPADSAGHEPFAGDLSVALDLAGWMLLRFRADLRVRGSAVSWLPVQRRGLEGRWHALRCAVYSPRPAPDADAAAHH